MKKVLVLNARIYRNKAARKETWEEFSASSGLLYSRQGRVAAIRQSLSVSEIGRMQRLRSPTVDLTAFKRIFDGYNRHMRAVTNETVIVTLSLPLYSIEDVVGGNRLVLLTVLKLRTSEKRQWRWMCGSTPRGTIHISRGTRNSIRTCINCVCLQNSCGFRTWHLVECRLWVTMRERMRSRLQSFAAIQSVTRRYNHLVG